MVDMDKMQMPITNQSAANRAATVSAARRQSNLAMSSGQAMMAGPAAAQKTAGQMAQDKGKIAAQVKEAELKQDVSQAQQELFNTEQRIRQQNMSRQEEMTKRFAAQRNRVSQLGRDVNQRLLEDQLDFEKTQRGVRFRNERQLADFLTTQTQEQEAFKDYEQHVRMELDKDIKMMNLAYDRLVIAEQREYERSENKRDKVLLDKIKAYKAALEAEARAAKRKANGLGRVMGAAKVVVGAAAMYYTGGVVGGSLVKEGAQDWHSAETANDSYELDSKYENDPRFTREGVRDEHY